MKSDTIQTNETNDQAGPMPTAEEVEPNEGTSGPPSVQELEARQIPLSEIVPSQLNPREIFAETPMGELVKSIERMDVLEPLVVRRYKDGYQIVYGERRYKALKRLGRESAPCIVRELEDDETIIAMLQESMHREPFNPIEEARGYEMLEQLGYSQQRIADDVGVSQTTICQRLKLLNLHDDLQQKVLRGELPVRKARVLADVPDQEAQLRLEDVACSEDWNATQLAAYAVGFTTDYERLTLPGPIDYGEALMKLRDDCQLTFEPELHVAVELSALARRYKELKGDLSRQAEFLERHGRPACQLMTLNRAGFVESLSAASTAAERLSRQLADALRKLEEAPDEQPDEDGEPDDGQPQAEPLLAEVADG